MKYALSIVALFALGACSDSTSPTNSNGLSDNSAGVVYTMTNAVAGNTVLSFSRSADGTLHAVGSFPTGGLGTGAGLGNQGAVALDESGSTLLVVNAGSNQVSSFRTSNDGTLQLVSTVSSGGTMPVSVTISHRVAYVLNAGGSGNIAGFTLANDGMLAPIANSSRPLGSAAAGAAEISFDPTGSRLVVTEKATNTISTYSVDNAGLASAPATRPSSGVTPYGFAFTNNGTLIVSEANGGAPDGGSVSSYIASGNTTWAIVSGSSATTETSACWIAVTQDGRYAYTTNAASGTITGFAVSNGALSRLTADGVTANVGAGSAPAEMAVSRNGKFLYANSGGQHAIVAYAIGADGSLTPLFGGAAGLPAGTNGLAAR